MTVYSVTEARAKLSSLIDKAAAGEEVVIGRRGKPVVELRAKKALSPDAAVGTYDWLTARRDAGPRISKTSVEILNEMYDEVDD
jgi:antitoxin (DNA-binding transcriptional repressor) of toxin-antitoxin stability system